MIQLCKNDKEKVYNVICVRKIDVVEMSLPNLINDIFLTMKKNGLTDVPFVVTEAELLAELGWNLWDNERDVNDGLFSESVIRKLLGKFTNNEWINFYNSYVKEHLIETLDIQLCIHILECTKILVNLDNDNYEEASVAQIKIKTMLGYKLSVLCDIMDSSGITEEITCGTFRIHDMEQCRKMLRSTPCFYENDILINDSGFLLGEMTNYLKTVQKVDIYLPARENMILFQDAVRLSVSSRKWQKHPNRNRKGQNINIQLVTGLNPLWENGRSVEDVPINTCVVHDTKTDKFFVFMITDTNKTEHQIINTYELRSEIEEDFHQMKAFLEMEDFKSTQYNYITYHIVMTLVGYLYFQIYKNLEEDRVHVGRSLPVMVKTDKEMRPKEVMIYVGQYFGIFPFLEFLCPYAGRTLEV